MEQGKGKTDVVTVSAAITRRSLMINVLDSLNLSFDPGEDDNEIFVQYQGEWFRVLFLPEETNCIEIQDNYCSSPPPLAR